MGVGANAFRGLANSQLFNTTYEGATASTKRQTFATANGLVAPGSQNTITAVGNMFANAADVIMSQQDGLLFDNIFVEMIPDDGSGEITLTDLELQLQSPPVADVIMGFVGAAYPTLLSPRKATLIGFQVPPIITGADMLFWARNWGGTGLAFPLVPHLAFIATFHNSGAGNHTPVIKCGATWRKLTGLAD